MGAEIEFVSVGPAPVPDNATEHMVPMRDGIRLATDVYLTGDGSPAPTVLVRLPYDKNGEYTFLPTIADYITARGYHVVVQDVRGKFRSEGVPILMTNEVDDGYDAIDWIVANPWSDGSVVMFGDSYYGFTQWAAAQSGHPALKAISPRVTGTRVGHRPILTAEGQQEAEFAGALPYISQIFTDADIHYWEVDWSARPLTDVFERFFEAAGVRAPSYDLAYPEYKLEGRFRGDPVFTGKPIPTLHTIGWWDNCAPWAWFDQEWITKDPEWNANAYLLLESTDHENISFGNDLDGREPTPEEMLPTMPQYIDPSLDFYDAVLNGRLDDVPRVRWNLAGTPGYRHAEAWPPADARPQHLALTAAGALAVEAGATADISWVHDPENMVPSNTPNSFAYLQYSPDDQALAERDDVIVFRSEEAAADTILAGAVRLDAAVEADNEDFHIFARLYDRAPDGSLTRIAQGQNRWLGAAGPVRLDIDLLQVGYLLKAGHALQLHVQASDYPEFLYSTGTGKSAWEETAPVRIRQTITVGEGGSVLTVHTLDSAGPAHLVTGGALG